MATNLLRFSPNFAIMNAQDDLLQRWWQLEQKLMDKFGKKPDLESILFLIGLQETGFIQDNISKEQKQDLMHVALCTVLMPSGYYELDYMDADGWPHFNQLKEHQAQSLMEQESLLKDHVLFYFQNEGLI